MRLSNSAFRTYRIIRRSSIIHFKANFNLNDENETQFGYLWADKSKIGREDFPGNQAPEALFDQEGNLGINPLEGILEFQHTWIPNDHVLFSLRYGYYSLSYGFIPVGGNDVPMIYLESIPRWKQLSIIILL